MNTVWHLKLVDRHVRNDQPEFPRFRMGTLISKCLMRPEVRSRLRGCTGRICEQCYKKEKYIFLVDTSDVPQRICGASDLRKCEWVRTHSELVGRRALISLYTSNKREYNNYKGNIVDGRLNDVCAQDSSPARLPTEWVRLTEALPFACEVGQSAEASRSVAEQTSQRLQQEWFLSNPQHAR